MSNNNEWKKTCDACAEGTPPERCAYYGDPDGCNAPTLGKHPEGDLAERLQYELEKAESRIAELERASGNAAEMHKALKRVESELSTMNPRGWGDTLAYIRAALSAPPEPPSDTDKMREALEYVLQFDATDEAAEQDGLTDAERIAEYADHIEECQKRARAALAKKKAVVPNEG